MNSFRVTACLVCALALMLDAFLTKAAVVPYVDYRWTLIRETYSVLDSEWIERATANSNKSFQADCTVNCGLLREAKAAYLPFDFNLTQITASGEHAITPYSMQQACKCMQKFPTVFAFGDSHMRRLLVSWMEDNDNIMTKAKETRVGETELVIEKSTFLPCAHTLDKPAVIKLTAWRLDQLETHVLPTLNMLDEEGISVNLLFVGFGIHNIEHNSISEQVIHVHKTLSNHPALREAKVVWLLSHMVAVLKSDEEYLKRIWHRNINIRHYNDVVVSTLSLINDMRWSAIDFYHLTRDRMNEAQDAAHFNPNLFRWKNHIVLDHICPGENG